MLWSRTTNISDKMFIITSAVIMFLFNLHVDHTDNFVFLIKVNINIIALWHTFESQFCTNKTSSFFLYHFINTINNITNEDLELSFCTISTWYFFPICNYLLCGWRKQLFALLIQTKDKGERYKGKRRPL